jgi:hypothetical protein
LLCSFLQATIIWVPLRSMNFFNTLFSNTLSYALLITSETKFHAHTSTILEAKL